VLVAVAVGYLALRYEVLGTIAPDVHPEITYVENPIAFTDDWTRVLTALKVLGRYLALLVWPFRLSPDYSFDQIPLVHSLGDPGLLGALATLAVLTAAAVAAARTRPIYLTSLLFYLATMLTVSNLIVPIGTIQAERFLYLPSLSICWVLAALFADVGWTSGWEDASGRTRLAFTRGTLILLAALVVPWTLKTVTRNAEWRNNRTLFSAARRISSHSAKVQSHLGDNHFLDGEYLAAIDRYISALRIYPDYAGAAINLASAYDAVHRYDEALRVLRSFEGRCGLLETARLRELARALVGRQDFAAAAEAYEKVLEAEPEDALAHRNLGGVYLLHLGNPERGRLHLRRSLELAPNQPGVAEIKSALEGR
jgi:tetratricopeptide (TPR) repeat protein